MTQEVIDLPATSPSGWTCRSPHATREGTMDPIERLRTVLALNAATTAAGATVSGEGAST